MTLDQSLLDTAKNLKKKADAAYKVLKKTLTTENASIYTASVRAYSDYCNKLVDSLIAEDVVDKTTEILQNIGEYETCKQCESKLIFLTSTNNYVASSDFLEDFPGWCYTCLLEHNCLVTDCASCQVSKNPATCSFREIKELHKTSTQESI